MVAPTILKGDKSSAASYRAISLTCILYKALEYIVASNVVGHMNKHDLVRHGFRAKRSYKTQLTIMVEDLARNACAGKQTDLMILFGLFKGS